MDLARPGSRRLLCAFALAAAGAFAAGQSVAQAGDEQRFPSDGVAPRVTCDNLKSLTLPNAKIISTTTVAGPANYCAVVGVVNQRISAQDPDHFTYGIGFQVNLPSVWKGRFELMGGGGTDGSLRNPLGGAGSELAAGWVVAANDGGHEDALPNAFGRTDDDTNTGGTAHFGIDEQAREDYGFNSIGRTVDMARRIIAGYYGWQPQESYFWGCSNGGREGIVASERYPSLFDGIVALNPGLDLPKVSVAAAWIEQSLAPLATRVDVHGTPYLPDTFPSQDLMVASAAILQACDELDGLVDGIVDNYQACSDRRVYAALDAFTCSTGSHGSTPHAGTCLTSAQVAALKRSFSGPVNSKREPLYGRWYWDAGIWDPPSAPGSGFAAWKIGSPVAAGLPLVNNSRTLTGGGLAMVFQTPPVVTAASDQGAFVFNFNFDTDAPKIFARTAQYPLSPMDFMAWPSQDLRPFKQHGGKLVLLDSVNDGVFSAAVLTRWYRAMARQTGGAEAFSRLYLVPNMAHCGGGPATNSYADNVLTAITDWIGSHHAPEAIVASNTSSASPFPTGGIFDPRVATNFPTGGTRLLCPYPRTSRYKGTGSTDKSSSFSCVGRDPRDQDRDDE